MTMSLQKAKKYAALKGTKVIEAPGGYKIADDHKSIVFVVEAGQKLSFTDEELDREIEKLESKAAKAAAIQAINAGEEEPAAKPKGKGKGKPAEEEPAG